MLGRGLFLLHPTALVSELLKRKGTGIRNARKKRFDGNETQIKHKCHSALVGATSFVRPNLCATACSKATSWRYFRSVWRTLALHTSDGSRRHHNGGRRLLMASALVQQRASQTSLALLLGAYPDNRGLRRSGLVGGPTGTLASASDLPRLDMLLVLIVKLPGSTARASAGGALLHRMEHGVEQVVVRSLLVRHGTHGLHVP